MAQQIINTGAYRNDPNADPMWIGGTKINENFTELYDAAALGNSRYVVYASHEGVPLDSNVMTGGGTDATSTIQEILDRASNFTGGLTFVLDGPARISDTLIIKSNTTILCPTWDCGIFLTANSNCEMIRNEGIVSANTQYGWPSVLLNVAENIIIDGGTWNQNGLNQTRWYKNQPAVMANTRWNVGMLFAGVNNLTLTNHRIYEARTFAFLICYADSPTVTNYTAEWASYNHASNNDTVHYWGPITGTNLIQNITSLNGGDDVLGMTYGEATEIIGVPIVYPNGKTGENTVIENVYAPNCQSFFRATSNYLNANMGDFTVRNCNVTLNSTGPNSWPAFIVGQYDRIFCENWVVNLPATMTSDQRKIEIHPTVATSDTIFKNIDWTGDNSTAPVFTMGYLNGTGKGHRLLLDNVRAKRPAPVQGVLFEFLDQLDNNGLDILEIRNCELDNYAAAIYNQSSLGNIATITWENNFLGDATIYTLNSTKSLMNVNPKTFEIICSGWTNTVVGTGSYTAVIPASFILQTGATTGSTVLASGNPSGLNPLGQNDCRSILWQRPVAAEFYISPNAYSATTKIRMQVGEDRSKTTVSDLDKKGMGILITNDQIRLLAHNGTTLTTSVVLETLTPGNPFSPVKLRVVSLGTGEVRLYKNDRYAGGTLGGPTTAGAVTDGAFNVSVDNTSGTTNLQLIVNSASWITADEVQL